MSNTSQQHQAEAARSLRSNPIRCAVLTVSDTRTMETDKGGSLIVTLLEAAQHVAADRAIVADEPSRIREQIERWLAEPSIQAVLITGGTGIAPRDCTIDVVSPMLTIRLDGFGELFRMLSYEQVKAAAMMSRAVAGLVARDAADGGETLVFAMPGSPNAVELAMSRLIVPQLPHLVWERRR